MKPECSIHLIHELIDVDDEEALLSNQYHTIYTEAEKWKRRDARFQQIKKVRKEAKDMSC